RSRFDHPHRDPEQKLIRSPSTLKKPRPVGGLSNGLTLLIFCLSIFSACIKLGPVVGGRISSLQDDLDRKSLRRAIAQSLRYLEKIPADRLVGEWPKRVTAGEVRESLLAFVGLLERLDDPEKLQEEIHARFQLYPSAGISEKADVLFTGYYQPVIDGSLKKTALYRFPIYRKPDDLWETTSGDMARYYSRHDIDRSGRLSGKGYEIAWVRDPVDLFFLHLQGSGLLRLEDGRLLRLNYAVSNGRPYTSIGQVLVERGKLRVEDLSMQRLRRYLKEHPEERDELLARNERYIFFRFVKESALGSLGVPLTAGRSIATDSRLFPKGALAFIITQRPILDVSGEIAGWRPFSRFVLNQDTGSAIRGTNRVDLYFGTGPQAGAAAGHMKSRGRLYFLVIKRP
ncbi:MAG: MltA domain-containing protein, partial [Candidatus Binatia bacterium]|nr:MltA domain-containing protein [Candidatus Binatia bacterium]